MLTAEFLLRAGLCFVSVLLTLGEKSEAFSFCKRSCSWASFLVIRWRECNWEYKLYLELEISTYVSTLLWSLVWDPKTHPFNTLKKIQLNINGIVRLLKCLTCKTFVWLYSCARSAIGGSVMGNKSQRDFGLQKTALWRRWWWEAQRWNPGAFGIGM